MDDRVWKNVSIVLGVVCALLIGVAGALMIVGHRTDSTPGASPTAGDVASGSIAPGDSNAPDSSTGITITPAPTPTPGPPAPATIAFTGLGLDAANDKNGTTRTFTLISDGAGPVVFAVTKISGGTARMCADVDASGAHCKDSKVGALYTFNFKSDPTPNTWVVSFFGYGSSTPTIDVSFTWTTSAPKVTLSHGRFQGSSTSGVAESLNGFTASFKPRHNGALNVQAAWTVVTSDASMTLLDASTPPAVTVDTRTYKAVTYVNPAFTANVDQTKTYQVKLRNTSADSQRPDLTVQITFP